MRMTFKVTYLDGRVVQSVARPKDIVAFERQYNKSMADFADKTKQPPMEWLYYLAWSPLHRLREERAAFDEFLDLVDEIEGDVEVPVVDPTQPAASAASSPASRSAPASRRSRSKT